MVERRMTRKKTLPLWWIGPSPITITITNDDPPDDDDRVAASMERLLQQRLEQQVSPVLPVAVAGVVRETRLRHCPLLLGRRVGPVLGLPVVVVGVVPPGTRLRNGPPERPDSHPSIYSRTIPASIRIPVKVDPWSCGPSNKPNKSKTPSFKKPCPF